jgi:hypothetical protein
VAVTSDDEVVARQVVAGEAAIDRRTRVPALGVHVENIVALGANAQMSRFYAQRVVARVHRNPRVSAI